MTEKVLRITKCRQCSHIIPVVCDRDIPIIQLCPLCDLSDYRRIENQDDIPDWCKHPDSIDKEYQECNNTT